MKKHLLSLLVGIVCSAAYAAEPDMIVTQDGESIQVYNLEITPNAVYYTISEDSGEDVKKMSKDQILIIKKADGTKIDPSVSAEMPDVMQSGKKVENPHAHAPVTYVASGEILTDKKGNKIVPVKDNKGQDIYFRIVDGEDKTLALTSWFGKGKYEGEEYILPEYVTIGHDTYTVRYVDDKAFYIHHMKPNKRLKKLVFPSTLKKIGNKAFSCCSELQSIILPESIETVGDNAFSRVGNKYFDQIYLPKGLKTIGSYAFLLVGADFSPNGYFQGRLTSMPDFITESNCNRFGIDEEAIEVYEKRNK